MVLMVLIVLMVLMVRYGSCRRLEDEKSLAG